MLSDRERSTLRQIQADLAESDPELARFFVSSEIPPTPVDPRGVYVIWAIAAAAAVLALGGLALGSAITAFLGTSVVLGALVGLLWCPRLGLRDLLRGRPHDRKDG